MQEVLTFTFKSFKVLSLETINSFSSLYFLRRLLRRSPGAPSPGPFGFCLFPCRLRNYNSVRYEASHAIVFTHAEPLSSTHWKFFIIVVIIAINIFLGVIRFALGLNFAHVYGCVFVVEPFFLFAGDQLQEALIAERWRTKGKQSIRRQQA